MPCCSPHALANYTLSILSAAQTEPVQPCIGTFTGTERSDTGSLRRGRPARAPPAFGREDAPNGRARTGQRTDLVHRQARICPPARARWLIDARAGGDSGVAMTPTRGPHPGKGGPGPGRRHREAAGEGLVRRGVRPYALRRAMQALISHAARRGRLLARPFFWGIVEEEAPSPEARRQVFPQASGGSIVGWQAAAAGPAQHEKSGAGPTRRLRGRLHRRPPRASRDRAQRPPPQPQGHPAFVPPLARARSGSGRPRPGAGSAWPRRPRQRCEFGPGPLGQALLHPARRPLRQPCRT